MKKLFMMLVSLLVIFLAFVEEGGALLWLIAPTVIVPLILGTLFSTLFSYKLSEIIHTFKEAFSQETNIEKLIIYRKSILIIQTLGKATQFWSLTILLMGLFLVLSNVTKPEDLGPSIAVSFLSLLYGFGVKASLYVPMESSLRQKIFQAINNS